MAEAAGACGEAGAYPNLTRVFTIWMPKKERGVAGGFTQANHGKPHMLKKMARGDWIVFYSPKTVYPDGEPLQAFTAIGQAADDWLFLGAGEALFLTCHVHLFSGSRVDPRSMPHRLDRGPPTGQSLPLGAERPR